MTLNEFIATLPPKERRTFRRQVLTACQVTPAAWYQWLTGVTQPSPMNARHLARLSGWQVTLETLRPGDYAHG
jgi:DNA-binding transcriptional regulator YdaS (Cro superfamily)